MKNDYGVYALVFHTKHGDMTYIGSTTVSFRARLNHHMTDLRHQIHHSNRVQRLWNKYNHFDFRVLEVCSDKTQVPLREQFYIENADQSTLINFGPALPAPFFGKHHTTETRKKISDAAKGKPKNLSRDQIDKTIKRLAKANKGRIPWNKGRHNTPEQNQKIKDSLTPEGRLKMSLAHKGKPTWNKGRKEIIKRKRKPQSEETKRKISLANKGKKRIRKNNPGQLKLF